MHINSYKYIFILLLSIVTSSNSYVLRPIISGLSKPLSVISRDIGDKSVLLIAEQGGVVKLFDSFYGKESIFIDISDRSFNPRFPADERGLLGIEQRGALLYTNYSNKYGDSVISSFVIDTLRMVADPRSEIEILYQKQPFANHNGGHLAFGPDGCLYIGLGDGGSAGDPMGNSQNLNSLLGKILRVIPYDSIPGYYIPESNPFYNDDRFNKEILLYGLRNPWRFSFDSLTGDLYIGDVGQSNWEEINIIRSNDRTPHNMGWNIYEGMDCYKENECVLNAHYSPVFIYPNNASYIKTILGMNDHKVNGCSVTGGVVYRGNLLSDLYGKYIFGDYCTGKIWALYLLDDKYVIDDIGEKIFDSGRSNIFISSFGLDEDNELLIVDYKGIIYRLDIR